MKTRVSILLTKLLLVAVVLLATSCGVTDAGLVAPTEYGPLPSPRPAFTGLALPTPAILPSETPSPIPVVGPTATAPALAPSGQGGTATLSDTATLTILFTGDTRGFVDPCG